MSTRAAKDVGLPLAIGGAIAITYAAVGLLVDLPRTVTIGLAVLLLLAAPTSALLSRRILINSAIAVGWFPATWWLPFGFGSLGRTGAFTAVALGATVAASLTIRRAGGSIRPRVNAVDLLIPVAGLAVLWFTHPWWAGATPADQLSRLLIANYDHAAHFGMTFMQRSFEMLPAAGTEIAGSPLYYASYVQYTNALVNGAIELWAGPRVLTAPQELMLYMPATSAIYAWLAVMTTAGIVQLPKLRRRPALLLLVVTFATTVIALGPGGGAFGAGHLNIVHAGLCVTALVLLTARRRDLFSPLIYFASAGLILAAAGAWSLIAPMAIAVGIATILLLPRWLTTLRRHVLPTAVTTAVLAAGLVIIAAITSGYAIADQLGVDGRVVGSQLGEALVVVSLALFLCGWPLPARTGDRHTISPQAWIVIVILGWTVAFAVFQLTTYDTFSYYFWKLLQGTQLALIGSVAVGAVRLSTLLPRRLTRPQQAWAAVTTAVLMLTTVLGYGAPTEELGPRAPSIATRNAEYAGPAAATSGERLLRAYDKARQYPPGTVTYYAVADGDSLSPRNDAWLHALLGDWTIDVEAARKPATDLRRRTTLTESFLDDTANRIKKTLEIGGPGHVVIITPELHEDIAQRLPAGLRARLVAY